MPKIPSNVIDSVFYLYDSKDDAVAGRNPAGTGFLVQYFGKTTSGFARHLYGVTNWHIACRGHSVIRLNTEDGGIDVVDIGPEEWEFLPGRYDVAVVPLALGADHKVSWIPTDLFDTPRAEHSAHLAHSIGVGDDVFMLGLFVDHDGLTTNVPSARFGNISMLPNENATIEQPTGYRGVSYVVDMHSRSGFSGSPVFVYRTFGNDLSRARYGKLEFEKIGLGYDGRPGRLEIRTLFRFLGIHWGQFPETWELRNKRRIEESRKNHLITEGVYVEGLSGITCVIPAWHVMEVLDLPKLKDRRAAVDAAAEKQHARRVKPKADGAASGLRASDVSLATMRSGIDYESKS